jgi:hypothetical protein
MGARVQGPWEWPPVEGSSSVDPRMINHFRRCSEISRKYWPPAHHGESWRDLPSKRRETLASGYSGWPRSTSTLVLLELAPTDVCPWGTSQN